MPPNRNVGFSQINQLDTAIRRTRSQPLTEKLKTLLEIINEKTADNFNGILINEYTDGTNSIGAHSDDESGPVKMAL